MLTRRQFLKVGAAAAGLALMPGEFVRRGLWAIPAAPGLSDPALQPKFVELAPNALDPGFLFKD
nr:hypothetical protein [Phycisphaerae bacterium]NIX29898.1 hypothetical protein [Phycisphaerae bacterium]